MTERGAPPDWGFDYRQDDPYEDDGWFGREQDIEAVSVDDVAPVPTQKPDVGVTRTPVTRAPISVAPQPRTPTETTPPTQGMAAASAGADGDLHRAIRS